MGFIVLFLYHLSRGACGFSRTLRRHITLVIRVRHSLQPPDITTHRVVHMTRMTSSVKLSRLWHRGHQKLELERPRM
uniref:Putative secreted peptide n=1 Tax=Anopheles braziliensis TaxID=58242 RepID=A0A2M3ZT39_9DIPT